MKNPLHNRPTKHYNIGRFYSQRKDIDVLVIESIISASDCNKDNYLFDWQNNISYLVLED
jgi:hypothetical protein